MSETPTEAASGGPQDTLRWLFVGPEGLRSGYRASLFTVGFIVVTVIGGAAAAGVMAALDALGVSLPRGELFLLLNGITFTPALLLTLVAGAIERPRLISAGVGGPVLRTVAEAGGGALLGGLLVLLALLGPAIGGSVRFDALAPGRHWLMIPLWFVGLAIAATWEEIAFRGYHFQWLCRATGNAFAAALGKLPLLDPDRLGQWLSRAGWVGLSSIAFGLLHWSNPNADLISTVNTMLAGVWLAVAVFRSRALWLACGLHFGWNFAQGPVLGLPISGLGSSESGMVIPSLWSTSVTGPQWLTGGGYGIEASLSCTAVLILGIAISGLWPPRRRGEDAAVLRPGAIDA